MNVQENASIKLSIYCEKQDGLYGKSFKRLFSSMLHTHTQKIEKLTTKPKRYYQEQFSFEEKHITRFKVKRYFLLIKSL